MALAACTVATPAPAGQTGSSFQVSVQLLPPTPTCTTRIDAAAVPQVDCRPPGADSVTASGLVAGTAPTVHVPRNRMMLAGPAVEVGEQSFAAWSEYSSRLVVTRSGEYLEMTVTW